MNDDVLDALTVLSFLIGVANYGENLTQSDKDDLLKKLEHQTNDIVERIEIDLKEQNELLERIVNLLEENRYERD